MGSSINGMFYPLIKYPNLLPSFLTQKEKNPRVLTAELVYYKSSNVKDPIPFSLI